MDCDVVAALGQNAVDDDDEDAGDVKRGHLRWAARVPARVMLFVFPADASSTDAETSQEAKLIISITSKMNSLMLIQMWITIKQKHSNIFF